MHTLQENLECRSAYFLDLLACSSVRARFDTTRGAIRFHADNKGAEQSIMMANTNTLPRKRKNEMERMESTDSTARAHITTK
jgi:hypothetical protein